MFANKSLTYMVKQLNYVWLTAENYSEAITNYIEYNSIHGMSPQHVYVFLSRGVGKVYCDVITRSHLQLINTLINTFSGLFSGTKKKKEGQ